jgi:pimeloyl-ACP methyl ester carboxylesterase
MKLFYREMGNGSPVIIVHGLFGMSDNWMNIAKQLADHYKIYLPDMRNHGSSPHHEEWSYDVMAEDLAEFIELHKIKDPVLIGHSMGGKVVMKLVNEQPDLVKKLVVVDISPRYYKPHHQHILDAMNDLDLASFESRQEADEALKKSIKDWGIRQFLLKNIQRNKNGFEWKHNLALITKKIEEVGQSTMPEWPVETPSLFIRGANSDYISNGDIDEIKSQYVNSQVVTLKNAGHWIHAEQPEAFVKTITSFIEA